MISRTVRLAAGALSLVFLSACGSLSMFDSRTVEYKSAGKLPPLEIPPDLTAPAGDDRYAVPEVTPGGSATYSQYNRDRATGPAPGSTGVLPTPASDGVRIERAGTQRWLVVPGTPEQLWPVVRQFWQESGFLLKTESAETGVMETDWAENRAKLPQDPIRNLLGRVIDSAYSTAERDKFRTRLERGSSPGTTEIYVSHRGLYEVYVTEGKDQTRWQPRAADPDLEAEMLRRLMARLGVEPDRAQSLVAGAAAEPRARIVKDAGGRSSLAVDDGFDRAWRRVGLALDRIGFTVEDRDRSKGTYFVRYVDPEADARTESKGILSRFKFWGDDEKKLQAVQYQVSVQESTQGARVDVLNRDGKPESSAAAGRILSLLFEQLK